MKLIETAEPARDTLTVTASTDIERMSPSELVAFARVRDIELLQTPSYATATGATPVLVTA